MVLQVLLPPKARGTVTYLAPPGNYTIKDKILETEFDGQKTEYTLMQVSNYPLCLSNSIMFKNSVTFLCQPSILIYRSGQYVNHDHVPKSYQLIILFLLGKEFLMDYSPQYREEQLQFQV